MEISTPETDPTTTNAATEIETAGGVLLLTDTGEHEVPPAVRAYACSAAQRNRAPLTVYDRAEETWGDSQHPDGPMTLGDDRLEDRSNLRDLMRELSAGGVTVQAWVSTLPSVSAVTSALSSLDVDLVVIPEDLSPKFFERALQGESVGESLATQINRNPTLSAVVVVVDTDGSFSIIQPV
jgi:hypothetical protein